MTLKIHDKSAVYIGLVITACGAVLSYQGEIGWIFSLPVIAAGVGIIAAGFTKYQP